MKASRLRRPVAVALSAAFALALTACGDTDTEASDVTGDAEYPLTLESAYGETVLTEKPETVAVMSSVDFDIALSLGITPVMYNAGADGYTDAQTAKVAELGIDEVPYYDGADGTDFEALRAAEPDVILATSGWTLAEDYGQLSGIAPIVPYDGEDGLDTMTWMQRLSKAAHALGESDRAEQIIADYEDRIAQITTDNPQFADLTISYAVVHPHQLTYFTVPDATPTKLFTDLGFQLPEIADNYTSTNDGVSLENIDHIDADVLLMGYPFGADGVLTRDELETNPLFQSLEAVKNDSYLVLDGMIPSEIAYPSPVSAPWVLDQLIDELERLTR